MKDISEDEENEHREGDLSRMCNEPTLTAATTGAVMIDRATPPVMAKLRLWRDAFLSS